MAPMSLLTCGVVVGGEHGGALAVFPHDGVTKAWMGGHRPRPWPRQALTWLRKKGEGRDRAAARFAGIRVTTAVNPTTTTLWSAAHLGEISTSQEVEKMEELEADSQNLGGEVRHEDESVRSSWSSRRQWRWRFRRRSRERAGGREWTGTGRVRGGVASMTASTTWRVGPAPAYGRQMAARCCAGRPRRRAELTIRACNASLVELLWSCISSKPWRIRRWCSWHSWSTDRVLQVCQLEQRKIQPGWRDMKLPKSIR